MTEKEQLDKYFEVWKQRIKKLIYEHPLQIISWEATRRCNLNCVHCGSPAEEVDLGEELTTEEVISAFERIRNEFDMSNFKHINITGGEPFVRKDLLNILKHLSQYPEYRNTDIQTNGIYIASNPEVLNELADVGVTGLGISIDGMEKTHNSFRNVRNGFEKAVIAAERAVKKGYIVTASIVVHAKNINEIPEIYDYIKDKIKPRVFRLMFLDPIGRTDFDSEYLLSSEQSKWVIDFLREKYSEDCSNYADPQTMMVELGCGGWFGKELEGTFRPFIFHCIAGINNLGILFDGKLASCSNISREFIEGDLRKDNIKQVWDQKYQRYRNRDWRKTGECKNCEDWDYCHGGPFHLRTSIICHKTAT